MELYEIIRLAAEGVLAIYAGCMLYRSCKWEKRAVENGRAFGWLMKDNVRLKRELQAANLRLAQYRTELKRETLVWDEEISSGEEKGEKDGERA